MPERILVLQLSRMGDLAQSLPLIHALSKKYSNSEIILACRKGIHLLLQSAELPATVLPLPQSWLNALTQITDVNSKTAQDLLLAQPILTQAFQSVINLNLEFEMAVITSLVNASSRYGRIFAPQGEVRTQGKAARYLWAMVKYRTENLFNLSDLQMLMAGLTPTRCQNSFQIQSEALLKAQKKLLALGWDGKKTLIGIQVGASDSHRAWSVTAFAKMASNIVLSLDCQFVLFGDTNEQKLARCFCAEFQGKAIDLSGQTALSEFPPLLKCCDLVIGNDTGTLHVAAATGVKTLGIFFATAFFTETAPYGEGHSVLQTELHCSPCSAISRCTEQKCRQYLLPHSVADAALWVLGIHFEPPEFSPELRFYTSRFDDNELLLYEPADSLPPSLAYQKALNSRAAWTYALGIPSGGLERAELIHAGEIPHDTIDALLLKIEEGKQTIQQVLLGHSELKKKLLTLPLEIIGSCNGILSDYCRLALMDLDSENKSNFWIQITARFEEIHQVALALKKRSIP